MKTKTVVIILTLLALITTGGFSYYNQVYVPGQAAPKPAYNTTTVRSGDISITAPGAGSVLPAEKISVGFPVAGVLAELNVKVGDALQAGQVLARLDDTDARLKLRQAELNYNNYFSPNSLLQAESASLAAQIAVKTAEDELGYLISPTVFYWEKAIEKAQADLNLLKSSSSAAASDLLAAQKALEKAQNNLKYAQGAYGEYVCLVFPYSYEDDETGEIIDTCIPPTKDEIGLARFELASARLNLKDAEDYLQALKSRASGLSDKNLPYLGASLTKLDQARLDLDAAQTALQKTRLAAPVSGTVTAVSANPGQALGTTPFLTIETLDRMALRFYIEENDIHLVKVGIPVDITFNAYQDQTFRGTVTYIEPAIQTVDGTPAAVLWASLPDKIEIQLFSGMSAEVEVISGEAKNALLVPVQALRKLAADSYAAFVLQADGTLKLTPVTVGLKDYANAQILSGLKAGDVISTGAVETK